MEWQNHAEVDQLFSQSKVTGTFVLYDVKADRLIGHDQARAKQRFFPASTFKIPNTLIGLSAGAVASVDEVLPYGGKKQRLKIWEQDMSLREAIKASNFPVYQELARRINKDRMRDSIDTIDYGNKQIGDVLDNFWLVGPMAISAIEQTQFLARLANDQLPFPKTAMQQTRDIVLQEHNKDWALYSKTGWADTKPTGIGWWVGWVVKNDRLYTFALNLDIRENADAEKRMSLAKACLKALGII